MTLTMCLLDGPAVEMALPGKSHDFQRDMFHRYGDQLTTARPELVILTRQADCEADVLSLRLAKRDIPVLRLDVEDLTREAAYEVCLGPGPPAALSVAGRRCGERPLLWTRHLDFPALTVAPQAGSAGAGADRRLATDFTRMCWQQALVALTRAPGVRCINSPDVMTRLDRLTQLTLAGSIGLRVPKTLVTNDPAPLAEFAASCPHGVIAKTVADHFVEVEPGRLLGVFPRRLAPGQAASADGALSLMPAMYQEYLPARTELRVNVVGAEVTVFRVTKSDPRDLWDQPNTVGVEQVPTEAGLARTCLQLMRVFGLDVGAIDFLETDGGLVFLEVNTTGDWLYFEQQAGSAAVTDAVERFLLTLLRGAR